jgi:hypothetical protein
MHLVDLEALAVEGDVDWGDWQVLAFGLETGLIGGPGQSETLAFGRDPVRVALVGVAGSRLLLVSVLSVSVFAVAGRGGDLLLGVRFIAGGAVRSSVAIIKKSIELL